MQATLLKTLIAATGQPDKAVERNPNRTYQATVVGTDAVSATVIFEGSNDEIAYITIGTVTLTGTTSVSDGFASSGAWAYTRARCTAVSGTGALVTASMGA